MGLNKLSMNRWPQGETESQFELRMTRKALGSLDRETPFCRVSGADGGDRDADVKVPRPSGEKSKTQSYLHRGGIRFVEFSTCV
jgi:hypothetical protein